MTRMVSCLSLSSEDVFAEPLSQDKGVWGGIGSLLREGLLSASWYLGQTRSPGKAR